MATSLTCCWLCASVQALSKGVQRGWVASWVCPKWYHQASTLRHLLVCDIFGCCCFFFRTVTARACIKRHAASNRSTCFLLFIQTTWGVRVWERGHARAHHAQLPQSCDEDDLRALLLSVILICFCSFPDFCCCERSCAVHWSMLNTAYVVVVWCCLFPLFRP